jgi:hypothetical protein
MVHDHPVVVVAVALEVLEVVPDSRDAFENHFQCKRLTLERLASIHCIRTCSEQRYIVSRNKECQNVPRTARN